MERDSAQSDEVVGHARHAEPARGIVTMLGGSTRSCRCEPSREVPCVVSGSRRRVITWYRVWCVSSAAIALLHDPVGTRHAPPRATTEAVSVTVGTTPHSRVGLPKGPASGRGCDRYGLSKRPHNA